MNMSYKEQEMNEVLSASFDAEQSDIETEQLVDALLNDSALKKQYIRAQIIDDSLHQQIYDNLINSNLRSKIMFCLEDLPAHSEQPVNIIAPDTAKQPKLSFTDVISGWMQEFLQGISRMLDNKIISGVSVAASVMFATLFSLQFFNSNATNTLNNNIATSPPIKSSLIQLSSKLAEKSVPPKKHIYSTTEPVSKFELQSSSRYSHKSSNQSSDKYSDEYSDKSSDLQDVEKKTYKQATIEINE